MRRLLIAVAVVWACSCGTSGHLPAWVQQLVPTASASPASVCATWSLAYNQQATIHASPLRIVRARAHSVDSEGLVIVCALNVINLATSRQACYRMVLDTSYRIWQPPVRVRCNHPWEKPRPIRPIA